MSAENMWEKGMAARRAVANLTPGYSKTLKFKVLKPVAVASERLTADDFDVELEQDSGGNDETELLKLLKKVEEKMLLFLDKIFLLLLWPCQDLGTGSRSAGSGGKRKWVWGAVAMNNNVVSLQIDPADIMAMNRVAIRSERTPVPVQPARVCGSQCPSLSKGVY